MEPPVNPPIPVAGSPTRIWRATVATVNVDGSVDVRALRSRAMKVSVPCPDSYSPVAGDVVAVCDMDGDPQTPYVLAKLTDA